MFPLLVGLGLMVGTLNASTSIGSDIEYATTTQPTLIKPIQLKTLETGQISSSSIKTYLEAYRGSQTLSTSTIDQIIKVIECESNFYPNITSPTHDKGLVQINSVWKLSDEEMFDPYFSLNFIAEQFPKHPHYWVCFDLLNKT